MKLRKMKKERINLVLWSLYG